jgi:hypothetical protein
MKPAIASYPERGTWKEDPTRNLTGYRNKAAATANMIAVAAVVFTLPVFLIHISGGVIPLQRR